MFRASLRGASREEETYLSPVLDHKLTLLDRYHRLEPKAAVSGLQDGRGEGGRRRVRLVGLPPTGESLFLDYRETRRRRRG